LGPFGFFVRATGIIPAEEQFKVRRRLTALTKKGALNALRATKRAVQLKK